MHECPERTRVAEQVVETCHRLVVDRLVVGTAGNVSARLDCGHIVITPSGVPYADLRPETLPVVAGDGEPLATDGPLLRPTSELGMHLAMYAHPFAARAVVHTHATAATAVSTLVESVPSIHYALAVCGPSVRVAPYAPFGSPELAESAATAMRDRTGALLANHGTITIGDTLDQAYTRTANLEWTCQVWLQAAAAGTPRELTDDQIADVVRRLTHYGQPRSGGRTDRGDA